MNNACSVYKFVSFIYFAIKLECMASA